MHLRLLATTFIAYLPNLQINPFLMLLKKPQEKCETKKQDLYHNDAYYRNKDNSYCIINKIYAGEKNGLKKNQKPIYASLKLDLELKKVIPFHV